MSENKNVAEMYGCIVCAKTFNVLAMYSSDHRLVDCIVTNFGGYIVPDKRQPLVICDTHTPDEIEAAYQRWQVKNEPELDNEQVDE